MSKEVLEIVDQVLTNKPIYGGNYGSYKHL